MNFIHRLRDELGITILLIEHQMRVVMGISELITVLILARRSPKDAAQIRRIQRSLRRISGGVRPAAWAEEVRRGGA